MDGCKNQNRPPRGKVFERIARRERSRMLCNPNDDKWLGTDFTIAAKIITSGDYRYINADIRVTAGDREIIRNGGWLESE